MDVARYRRVDPAGFAASLGVRRRGPGTYGVRYGSGAGAVVGECSRAWVGSPGSKGRLLRLNVAFWMRQLHNWLAGCGRCPAADGHLHCGMLVSLHA